MTNKKQNEQYSQKESARRLEAILRGAFSGPPTPLKDIPKRNGASRAGRASVPMKDIPKKRTPKRAKK